MFHFATDLRTQGHAPQTISPSLRLKAAINSVDRADLWSYLPFKSVLEKFIWITHSCNENGRSPVRTYDHVLPEFCRTGAISSKEMVIWIASAWAYLGCSSQKYGMKVRGWVSQESSLCTGAQLDEIGRLGALCSRISPDGYVLDEVSSRAKRFSFSLLIGAPHMIIGECLHLHVASKTVIDLRLRNMPSEWWTKHFGGWTPWSSQYC